MSNFRRDDHIVDVNKVVNTEQGIVVVVRIDFQAKSVFLASGERIGFVKARKMGLEPLEVV